MQYLTLYTPAPTASHAPTPEHMKAMGELNDKYFRNGTLQLAAPLGRREAHGLRVTMKNGELTVLDAPKDESVLLGASGLSLMTANSRDELIAALRAFLAAAGDGSCEVIGLAMPAMQPQRLNQGPIPYITMQDASAASAFYQKAFAAKEITRNATPDGKKLMHCHLEIHGGSLMLCDAFPEHGHPFEPIKGVMMQLVVNDGDTWFQRAVDAGCKVVAPLEKQFWGDRWGKVVDPFGIEWGVNDVAQK